MQLKSIEAKEKGRFISRYDLHYDCGGSELVYEIVSRDSNLDSEEKLSGSMADAVLVAAFDASGERMLVSREFRPETGHVVYGLPGGLREPGETIEECAAREFREETGLRLGRITAVLPAAYCTVGIGNEMTVCVFAKADGEPRNPGSCTEEISPVWLTKQEMLKCIETEKFGSWCLAFAWLWAHNGFPVIS